MEDEIYRIMQAEIVAAIDNEILQDIVGSSLLSQGWVGVTLRGKYISETQDWASTNLKGQFRNFGLTWYFEKATDAALFRLRWE